MEVPTYRRIGTSLSAIMHQAFVAEIAELFVVQLHGGPIFFDKLLSSRPSHICCILFARINAGCFFAASLLLFAFPQTFLIEHHSKN